MSGSRNATAHLYGGRIGDGRPHTPSRPAPADGTPASTPGATPPLPPRSQGLSPTTGRATSQVSFADLEKKPPQPFSGPELAQSASRRSGMGRPRPMRTK